VPDQPNPLFQPKASNGVCGGNNDGLTGEDGAPGGDAGDAGEGEQGTDGTAGTGGNYFINDGDSNSYQFISRGGQGGSGGEGGDGASCNCAQGGAGDGGKGFIALAEFDKPQNGGNADGKISNSDTIFPSLLLWQDTNHSAFSEAGELHTLSAKSLASIELNYKESRKRDQHGNRFRYRAKVRDTHGAQVGRWAWDVYFLKQ
jgi:hypothetical protein